MFHVWVVLTSMRRMSIDSTVVKKNIWRKKSDTRPTTANRQNSYIHKKKKQRLFAIGNCMTTTTTTKNRSYTCYLEELHLNCWYKCEVSNEDDAQFSGHILHDRPALIA